MIKAVIFDCFGVLTSDPWKEFVATLPENQVEPARALNYQYDSSQISEDEFITRVVELTGHTFEMVSAIRNVHDSKNAALLNYIRTDLKPDFKIGLLSNVSSNWIRDEFLDGKDLALFDDMLMSFEVRVTKPQPEIYHLAAERLGLSNAECLLVDDSELNCAGAHHVDMKAVLYRNLTQLKSDLKAALKN